MAATCAAAELYANADVIANFEKFLDDIVKSYLVDYVVVFSKINYDRISERINRNMNRKYMNVCGLAFLACNYDVDAEILGIQVFRFNDGECCFYMSAEDVDEFVNSNEFKNKHPLLMKEINEHVYGEEEGEEEYDEPPIEDEEYVFNGFVDLGPDDE